MSIFDLQKRQETVQFVLEKRNIKKAPTMRVGVALDVSGSAKELYLNGTMQATIDRLVPIGMRFDDNGELDVWSFDTGCDSLGVVSKHDYEDFIQRAVLDARISKWGGTLYAPPMQKMLAHYLPGLNPVDALAKKASGLFGSIFGAKKPDTPQASDTETKVHPAMALFITDGANSDREAARAVIQQSHGKPIYWQLIGVGSPSQFSFIKELADEYPNAGFVHLASLSLSDEQLYEALLTQELANFIQKL